MRVLMTTVSASRMILSCFGDSSSAMMAVWRWSSGSEAPVSRSSKYRSGPPVWNHSSSLGYKPWEEQWRRRVLRRLRAVNWFRQSCTARDVCNGSLRMPNCWPTVSSMSRCATWSGMRQWYSQFSNGTSRSFRLVMWLVRAVMTYETPLPKAAD